MNTVRAVAKDSAVADRHAITVTVEPEPGQSDVILDLVARHLSGTENSGHVVWHKPRFEGKDLPTLALRIYQQFGPRFEIDYSKLFAGTQLYLSAAIEAANTPEPSTKDLAAKHQLDEQLLKRWIAVLDVKPLSTKPQPTEERGRVVLRVEWTLLDAKTPPNPQRPANNGWVPKGTDLPVLVTNQLDANDGRQPHAVLTIVQSKQF